MWKEAAGQRTVENGKLVHFLVLAAVAERPEVFRVQDGEGLADDPRSGLHYWRQKRTSDWAVLPVARSVLGHGPTVPRQCSSALCARVDGGQQRAVKWKGVREEVDRMPTLLE